MAKTLFELLKEATERAQQGNWEPASGRTEEPFMTRSGRRLLYCYQASTGKHAYLDLETDMILSEIEAACALGYPCLEDESK